MPADAAKKVTPAAAPHAVEGLKISPGIELAVTGRVRALGLEILQ
jgi:hypothetical protein